MKSVDYLCCWNWCPAEFLSAQVVAKVEDFARRSLTSVWKRDGGADASRPPKPTTSANPIFLSTFATKFLSTRSNDADADVDADDGNARDFGRCWCDVTFPVEILVCGFDAVSSVLLRFAIAWSMSISCSSLAAGTMPSSKVKLEKVGRFSAKIRSGNLIKNSVQTA